MPVTVHRINSIIIDQAEARKVNRQAIHKQKKLYKNKYLLRKIVLYTYLFKSRSSIACKKKFTYYFNQDKNFIGKFVFKYFFLTCEC